MAAYPTTYKQLIGSDEEVIDDLKADRTVSGVAKGRSFFTAAKRRWTLHHNLNTTDVDAVLSFYNSNRNSANTFTWARDGVSYTVLFESPPKITPVEGAMYDVVVRFAQQ